ncbi:MAG TPA: EAL domain-containing protein [Gemmatimonadaceae bacterium]|nr:EAL domain-containing protein [Gemmatimonadaceae bacterium]
MNGISPRRTAHETFDDTVLIPGALHTMFQPIVRFGANGWTVQALECLTRGPAGTRFEDAVALFSAGRKLGRSAILDHACVTTALETVAEMDIRFPLYLNVDAETLIEEPAFPTFLAAMAAGCEVPWHHVTLEITEHARGLDIDRLANAVRRLHELEMRVAFDDFGSGEVDERALEACNPDIVKIEGPLLNAARDSYDARQLLERVVALARRGGATIVAEGLERPSDLFVAAQLGIPLFQGNLLCAPLQAAKARRADDHIESPA